MHCRGFFTGFMAFFGFSLVLALFWGFCWLFAGFVPNGLWGLSRWWDLLIPPVWLTLFLTVTGFLADEGQPYWVFFFITPALGIVWIVAGIISVFAGIAVLFWPFVIPIPILLGLQLRLACLGMKHGMVVSH